MAIDQIHDVQQAYRKILNSMSRPGTISDLHMITKQIDEEELPCFQSVFLVALTLLDAEVTFHVIGNQAKSRELSELLATYTMARSTTMKQADFFFVLKDATEEEVTNAFNFCKMGNLIDPQQSSTWIMETDILTNQSTFPLKGPGINGIAYLYTGLSEPFWQKRNDKTNEYPLGIDLIMADAIGQIACVPRTTSTEVV